METTQQGVGDAAERALAYLRGDMSAQQRAAFEAALDDDETLRRELEQARALLDTLAAAGERPVHERCAATIREAIRRGASDIHVVPEHEAETVVRFRIDGRLEEWERLPPELRQPVIDRWKLMADLNVVERRVPQDGRIPVKHEGKDFDLRVTVLPTLYGERVSVRILDRSHVLLGLDQLGLSDVQRAALERLSARPNGLVLFAGRAGSGRTTLAYSTLLAIRERVGDSASVLSVEDPVEVSLPGVAQMAVNKRLDLAFPALLRAALRSDPDVVFSGDLPDRETADACVELALTGHLALATLNAPSAVHAAVRLREMGVEPFLISAALGGAVAVALPRRVCAHCAEPYTPPTEMLRWLGLSGETDGAFRRGRGCDACGGSGYFGRVGLFEVLETDDALRRGLADNAPLDALWRIAFGAGKNSLRHDARAKVRAGVTTVEEATRALYDYPRADS